MIRAQDRRPAWVVPVLLVALFAVGYFLVKAATQERGQPPFPTVSVAAPTATSTTKAPTRSDYGLTLGATGLGRHHFGDPEAAVVAALVELLGPPTEDLPEECPGEPPTRWVQWADLGIRLQAGRFVAFIDGIHYPPGPPPFAIPTAQGLAPGDPATRLFELYDRKSVTEAPDPPEPSEQQTTLYHITEGTQLLTVVVEGSPESGQVIAISAGTFCRHLADGR